MQASERQHPVRPSVQPVSAVHTVSAAVPVSTPHASALSALLRPVPASEHVQPVSAVVQAVPYGQRSAVRAVQARLRSVGVAGVWHFIDLPR